MEVSEIEPKLRMAHKEDRRLALLRDILDSSDSVELDQRIELATEAIHIATALRQMDEVARMLLVRGEAAFDLGELQRAEEDLASAWSIFESHGAFNDAVRAAVREARLLAGRGRLADAVRWAQRFLLFDESDLEKRLLLESCELAGTLFLEAGDVERAIGLLLRSLALGEELEDRERAASVLALLGRCYLQSGDSVRALEHLTRSRDIYRSLGLSVLEVGTIAELGRVHLMRGEGEQAIELELLAMSIFGELGDQNGISRCLATIGEVYERGGDPKRSLEYFIRAHSSLDRADISPLRVEILRNIGAIRMRLREVQEARFVFDQALRMAEDIGDLRLQYQIHGALSDVYEQLGHHAQALEHHKRYAEMREEIAGEEKQKAIAELQIRFDVEKAEREREIYRLKAEQLENDMQHKQNELTAMALNLAQKNELLESLKAQIKRLQKKHKDGGEEIVEHIIKDIDASKSADDDWKLFEQQLEAVHPDFIRRLSDRYSALTPTELKICSLIKTNLSAKDIANFLYISVRTAEVHRLNIRKKLKLGRGISLATFLASI